MSDEEIKEFDIKGRLIYRKDKNGEMRYNSDGNIVYCKVNRTGEEMWVEYQDGRWKHFRYSDGYEEWCEYENGVLVRSWDSDGCEYWYELWLTCQRHNDGETWRQYTGDDSMKPILTYFKSADGKTETWHDEGGNQIYQPDPRCRNLDPSENLKEEADSNNLIWRTTDGE